MQLEVFQIGSPVIIGDNIEATIKSICIQEKYHITYECIWWSGNTRNVNWFEQIEISRADKSESIKIGFSNGNR